MVLLSNTTFKLEDKVVCFSWEGFMIHIDKTYVIKDINGNLTYINQIDLNRLKQYSHRFRKAYKNER